MDEPRYFQCTRMVECHNPISGHRWVEHVPIKRWEVAGGRFTRTRHNTEAAALRECNERIAFNAKFPRP